MFCPPVPRTLTGPSRIYLRADGVADSGKANFSLQDPLGNILELSDEYSAISGREAGFVRVDVKAYSDEGGFLCNSPKTLAQAQGICHDLAKHISGFVGPIAILFGSAHAQSENGQESKTADEQLARICMKMLEPSLIPNESRWYAR